jgi:uncharacterized membrane protein
MTRGFALSGDLSQPFAVAACFLAAASAALLVFELVRARRARTPAVGVAVSGLLAALTLLLAVLRPVAILSKGTLVGSKVIVLVDGSRSIDLPGLGGSRRDAAARALAELGKRASEVRLTVVRFGESGRAGNAAETAPGIGVQNAQNQPKTPANAGNDAEPPQASGGSFPTDPESARRLLAGRPFSRSDLGGALETIARAADERPLAIVVLSDGRLDRPGVDAPGEAVKTSLGTLQIPVHTVALATAAPADASIRAVKAAGAAVAHQPLSLRIEIGCDGGLECDAMPVVARELREQGEPTQLASGTAHIAEGKGTVELQVTLDRAGARILEIEITAPDGDTIPENNKRLISIDVARDRVRVLHVAGRPTYDVRALRMWLKADASVDVVAFFILRTLTDRVGAPADELALIPFPVDELFSVHLSSFDAVVLQDFDARPYDLEKHLPALARYVEKGGGLIMVGGPDSFVPGHYAGTPLARILPVELPPYDRRTGGVDLGAFVPRFTEAGRVAPVLTPLRALLGEELPEMPGVNLVGDARPDATVLLTHPTLKTPQGAPMPILALGEPGSGRTMALAIDGSHRLLFSAFAASAAGRAHGAFWDAMLGWLMRDPRFEPAVIDLPGACIAGEETTMILRPLPGQKGEATVTITRLGSGETVRKHTATLGAQGDAVEIPAGRLPAGGYSALVEIRSSGGKGPTTRRDFACEKGGDEWADSRPDAERLGAIAAATKGRSVLADEAGSLPLPEATQVATERHVAPLMPPWAWTLGAAVAVGAHWILRRRGGLL